MTEVRPDVAELAKKSSVLWIEALGRVWPLWHEWVDDAVYVVGSVRGGSEQPIPDLPDGSPVTLILRSKADRARAARVAARLEIIGSGSDAWEPATAALKAGRLNLTDSATAIDRWARECRVLRIVPLDESVDEPVPTRTLPALS